MFRSSRLDLIPKETLEELVKNSISFMDILKSLGYSKKGTGNYRTLKKKLRFYNINFSHITNNSKNYKIRKKRSKIPLELILVENSEYNRGELKRRLIKGGILQNKCFICDLDNNWYNKPLTLQLDHINGISNDNRIENLRLLCPNCHSQTPSFSGKNNEKTGGKRVPLFSLICLSCGKERKSKNSKLCSFCEKTSRRKIERPSKDQLSKIVWEKPTYKLALEFKVSDKAIQKWCKSYNIDKPPRGYWAKHYSDME